MNQPAPPSPLARFLHKFTMLRTAPRELWIIYGAYVLENIAYKLSAAAVLALWLTYDLGYTDKATGTTIGIWSAMLTLVTVLIGSLTDAVGIKKTFMLGFWICLISRIVMTVTTTHWQALTFGLYLQAVGLALMTPVMTAAMKRYSTAAQRSVAFSLYYALMNLGYAIGDRLFDHFRHVMGEHGHWVMPWVGETLSTYRVMFLWSVVFTVPGLLMTWFFMRDGVEMTEEGLRITPKKQNQFPGRNPLATAALTCRETAKETGRIFASLWGHAAFYRFLTFMTFIVGVRMVFYHLSYTFPKFGIRELGEGAPIAQISSMLNSVLCLIFVPICGVLTQKVSAYRMVMFGSLISALSVFLLAMPPALFQPIADGWFGDLIVHRWLGVAGPVNPLYIAIFLFTVGLSIGEAFWSPRMYEYAAAIAPNGKEASYLALSMLPYFAAKFGAGMLSGWLLQTYCPAVGARNSTFLWLIVGVVALITPVGTFLFRKQIQVQESGREPAVTKIEAAAKEDETLR